MFVSNFIRKQIKCILESTRAVGTKEDNTVEIWSYFCDDFLGGTWITELRKDRQTDVEVETVF